MSRPSVVFQDAGRLAQAADSAVVSARLRAAPELDMSCSRYSLPTLSSSRQKQRSAEVSIPDDVSRIAQMSAAARIRQEARGKRRAASGQRPSALFGSTFEAARALRETRTARGYHSEQLVQRERRDAERQETRLARSALAMQQSINVALGREEMLERVELSRPSPWAQANGDRHRFQVNWPNGIALPTLPDKWSGPGVGAYGSSTSHIKFDAPLSSGKHGS